MAAVMNCVVSSEPPTATVASVEDNTGPSGILLRNTSMPFK